MSSRPDPPFDFGTRLGLAFIVEAACLSALAVISTLLYIGVSIIQKPDCLLCLTGTGAPFQYTAVQINRRGWSSRKWSSGTYMHYYFLALMIFELIQAAGETSFQVALSNEPDCITGGMMNAKWVMQAVGLSVLQTYRRCL
jgi:hypothetical protein